MQENIQTNVVQSSLKIYPVWVGMDRFHFHGSLTYLSRTNCFF